LQCSHLDTHNIYQGNIGGAFEVWAVWRLQFEDALRKGEIASIHQSMKDLLYRWIEVFDKSPLVRIITEEHDMLVEVRCGEKKDFDCILLVFEEYSNIPKLTEAIKVQLEANGLIANFFIKSIDYEPEIREMEADEVDYDSRIVEIPGWWPAKIKEELETFNYFSYRPFLSNLFVDDNLIDDILEFVGEPNIAASYGRRQERSFTRVFWNGRGTKGPNESGEFIFANNYVDLNDSPLKFPLIQFQSRNKLWIDPNYQYWGETLSPERHTPRTYDFDRIVFFYYNFARNVVVDPNIQNQWTVDVNFLLVIQFGNKFLLVNGGTAVSDSASTDRMFGSGIGTQMSSDPAYENDMPEFAYFERELEMEAFMQLCESICGMPLDKATEFIFENYLC